MKRPKIIGLEPPSYQTEKVVLARLLTQQNNKMIFLLNEILIELKEVNMKMAKKKKGKK
jgi:hypothetical protein